MSEIQYKNGYYYEGDAKDLGIILLHAYTGTPNDVNLTARLLNREGHGVLCPQFTGHGTLDLNDLFQATPEDWKRDTLAAIDWMKSQGYRRLLVFGLSLGGILATWAITKGSLDIYAGGTFNSPVVSRNPLDLEVPFSMYARNIYRRGDRADDYNRDEAEIMAKHRDQIKLIDLLKAEIADDLPQIDIPFYVCQSGRDEMVDQRDVFLFLSRMVKAQIAFFWFPDNTHVITTNRNRKPFEESILHFVNYAGEIQ